MDAAQCLKIVIYFFSSCVIVPARERAEVDVADAPAVSWRTPF